MTKIGQIFKCDICSNVVEITHEGMDSLVCCSKDMRLLKENIASEENPHFAHVTKEDDRIYIKFNHVMTPEHHIEYIEAISKDGVYLKRKYLDIKEPAEMSFKCDCKNGFYVRLYCNIDECWRSECENI